MQTMVEILNELRLFESWEGDRFKWQPALLKLSYKVTLHGGIEPLWVCRVHDNSGTTLTHAPGINVLESARSAIGNLRDLINQNKVELREVQQMQGSKQ